jgi:hypothetical protein
MLSKRQRQIRNYLLILASMVWTAIALLNQPELRFVDHLPQNILLPLEITAYTTLQPLFCDSDVCRFSARFSTREPLPDKCPACRGPLHHISIAERISLGPETEISRRSYRSANSVLLDVMVVIAGKDRTNIHRPQNCLPAQGLNITCTRTLMPASEASYSTALRLLTIENKGVPGAVGSFAYFYTNGDISTPYQIKMFLEMARERLIDRQTSRWGYIAISATGSHRDQQEKEIADLMAKLWPSLDQPLSAL